ncbi:MAG: hypothetical protein ACK47B_07430 [Armatimonadota bacterium]
MLLSRASAAPGLLLAAALAAGVAGGCTRGVAAPADLALSVTPETTRAGRVVVRLTGGAALLRHHLGDRPEPARRDEVFYLTVETDQGPALPLLARLGWSGRDAVLEPQAPLTLGLTYRAVFDGPRLDPKLPRFSESYTPRPEDGETVPPPRVTAIYPSQAVVPANLLKFYLHFSRPMSEGRLLEHARLLDAAGREVPMAFRGVELWADEHRRATLWIQPGRTKRSLGFSETDGPVLRPGQEYVLEVRPGLRDQGGRVLAQPFRHRFRTAGFDRRQPRVEEWQLTAPAAGTREPLVVRLPEPLDHALAVSSLQVLRRDDRLDRGGEVTADPEVRTLRFTPAMPWQAGDYELQADGVLEDLAGNSLHRLFETAPEQHARPAASAPRFTRSFRIAP